MWSSPSRSAKGFAEPTGQRCFLERYRHKMDMVGHEAPGEDVQPEACRFFSQEGETDPTVFVGSEDIQGADAPLNNVVQVSGDNDARNPSHGRRDITIDSTSQME